MYLSDGNIIHRPPRSRSSHRGGPRNHAGLRGLAGGSPLPDQIVCEARSWLGTIEVPSGSNRGGRVDEIHGLYRGRDYKGTEPAESLAWCVEFAWVVIDRAVRALGGVNVLPGWGDTLANARATMEKAKQRLRVDGVPVVGACFFRVSTSQLNGTGTGGDGKSGHFGIVVGWDGQTLRTIEGNTGDNHNVGEYTYPAATVAKPENQFQFIHTELIPVTVSTPVPPCKPVSLPQSEGGTSVPTVPTPGGAGSTGRRPSDPSSGGSTPPDSGGSSSGGSVPPTQSGGASSTFRRCPPDMRVITLPASGMIKHYSVMQDQVVAADILGANFGDVPAETRNGSATTKSGSTDREGFSGIGCFTDRHGNLIWVTAATFKQYEMMNRHGLWGRDQYASGRVEPYIFRFDRWFGSTAWETTAEFLRGAFTDTRHIRDFNTQQQIFLRPDITKAFTQNFEGRQISYNNPIELLQELEKIGRRFDRPILILFQGEPFTFRDGVDLALKILATVIQYGPMFGIDVGKVLPKIQTAVQRLVEMKGLLTVDTAVQFLDIAREIAPESVRNEVDTALKSVREAAGGFYKEAAKTIGVVQADASRYLENIFRLGSKSQADVKTFLQSVEGVILNSSLGQSRARSIMQNILNVRTIERIQSGIESGGIIQDFIENGKKIAWIPQLGNLFLTGAAGKLMPLIPNIGEVMGPVIQRAAELPINPRDLPSIMNLNEMVRGMALSSVGIPSGDSRYMSELFSGLTYEALLEQARSVANAGLATFTLPDSVPEDRRECWAIQIAKDAEITVIHDFKPQNEVPRTSGGITTLTTLFPNVEIRPSTSTPTVPTTPKTPGTTINLPDFFGGTPRITEASSGGGTTGGGTTSGGTSRFSQTSGGTTSTTTTIPTTQREVPRTTTVTPGSSTPGGAIPGGLLPGSGGCPPGYMYINGQCLPAVQKETDRCPPGWHWDDMLWDCVPGTSTYPTKPVDPPRIVNCPQGYSWDGEKCVPLPPPPRVVSCPPGYLWDGEKCVPPVQTQSVPPVRTQSVPPVQVQSTPPVQTSSLPPPLRTMPVLPGTPTPPVQTSSVPPVEIQPSSGVPSIPRERAPDSPGVPDQPSSEGDCGCGCDDPEDCGCSAGLADLWSDMPRTFREFY